tara:strand:+ start:15971 stop:16975 length:1005 start_codon:yes stop_codon:yes gene_type:complete
MTSDKLGRQLKDLRISVTDRCNFRCPYCMPSEIYGDRYQFLPKDDLLTFEEITRLASIFANLGVNKIRITGGEPLVRNSVEELIANLSCIPEIVDLTMTTNGYLLPQKAQLLKNSGLNRITISLDTLDEDVFRRMNGRNFGPDRVLEGIKSAEKAGLTPIKINAVIQRGVNDHTILQLANFVRDRGHILRFIEYMDVGTLNNWNMSEVVPATEIIQMIDREMSLEALKPLYPGEVANRYRYKDDGGEIGVITSVTNPFCSDCTRLRLSPEGSVYTCLFSDQGTDLRSPLRTGANDYELRKLIIGLWQNRVDRYSEIRSSVAGKKKKIEMYHIGG